jgi:hypothetical protein
VVVDISNNGFVNYEEVDSNDAEENGACSMDISFEWSGFIIWGINYGVILAILIAVEYHFIYKKIRRKLDKLERAILEKGESGKVSDSLQ